MVAFLLAVVAVLCVVAGAALAVSVVAVLAAAVDGLLWLCCWLHDLFWLARAYPWPWLRGQV